MTSGTLTAVESLQGNHSGSFNIVTCAAFRKTEGAAAETENAARKVVHAWAHEKVARIVQALARETTYSLHHNSPWQDQGEYCSSAEYSERCRHCSFKTHAFCLNACNQSKGGNAQM